MRTSTQRVSFRFKKKISGLSPGKCIRCGFRDRKWCGRPSYFNERASPQCLTSAGCRFSLLIFNSFSLSFSSWSSQLLASSLAVSSSFFWFRYSFSIPWNFSSRAFILSCNCSFSCESNQVKALISLMIYVFNRSPPFPFPFPPMTWGSTLNEPKKSWLINPGIAKSR